MRSIIARQNGLCPGVSDDAIADLRNYWSVRNIAATGRADIANPILEKGPETPSDLTSSSLRRCLVGGSVSQPGLPAVKFLV